MFGFYWHVVIRSRCTSSAIFVAGVDLVHLRTHPECKAQIRQKSRWLRFLTFLTQMAALYNGDILLTFELHLSAVSGQTFNDQKLNQNLGIGLSRFTASLGWRQLLLRSAAFVESVVVNRPTDRAAATTSTSAAAAATAATKQAHQLLLSARSHTHGAKPGCVAISTYTTAPDASGCGRTLKNEFQLGMGVRREQEGGGVRGGRPPDSAWVTSTRSHSLSISLSLSSASITHTYSIQACTYADRKEALSCCICQKFIRLLLRHKTHQLSCLWEVWTWNDSARAIFMSETRSAPLLLPPPNPPPPSLPSFPSLSSLRMSSYLIRPFKNVHIQKHGWN